MNPKPGSFTPYLEYANGSLAKRSESPASAAAPAAAVATPAAPAATPVMILEILSRQVQRSLPIWDLQSLSGMDPVRFREALKSLLSLGYVEVDGASLEEVVRLTDKGVEAASIAR